jgi:hypothetical protein
MVLKKGCIAFMLGMFLSLVVGASGLQSQSKMDSKLVKRGEYLVTIVGCQDCHTPSKMGPKGPEKDMTRMLSGHPQDLIMTPQPKVEAPWMASVSATMTAWGGPWGVSYTRNLTPDKETGLGDWTEENFIATMRTGRRMGKGRAILPPMPFDVFAKMTDSDLKSIFAYLQTIPAVKNKVPEPVAPDGPHEHAK